MENQQNQLPENQESPAPKGWDSALYGIPDGDTPRRPGDPPRPLITGSGLPFRWQGFMIYFVMWVYGAILILNAIPVLNGSLQEEERFALILQYAPNMNVFLGGLAGMLLLLGGTIIVCRFLLARYLKCALPVFFAVSAADLLMPLLIPLGMYWAMQPFSVIAPLGDLYGIFFSPDYHEAFLYPAIVRLVLLICHGVYYARRRRDFSN